MKVVKTDYHIHPNYSIDASPTPIREYCYRAVELGLSEICFTTHVEVDPVRSDKDNFVMVNGEKVSVLNEVWIESYINEITEAQKEFKKENLQVKAGIEVGYCPGTEDFIEKITSTYPFDFVMGAIHCLKHIAISSKKESPLYYQKKSLEDLRADYFGMLKELVQTGLFDIVAHLDLYRRYGTDFYGDDIFTVHRGVIEPIFEEMARKSMGLEINTSSRLRGLQEFHPHEEIIALAAESGVQVFTVGSDTHSLEQLGGYIDEALAQLAKYNLSNHVFTKRQAIPVEKALVASSN